MAGSHPAHELLARFEAVLRDGTLQRKLHGALAPTITQCNSSVSRPPWAGVRIPGMRVVVMHVRDGKLAEVWLHVDDQYALDNFLNSLVNDGHDTNEPQPSGTRASCP